MTVSFFRPAKALFSFKSIICITALLTPIFTAAQDMPRMVSISPGSFMMGSERGGTDADESPVHKVTISRPFRMSETEITNLQYEQFRPEHKAMRGKDGFSSGDNEAVVHVSYNDAVAYCDWLSEKTGRQFRLPTEAEWEYACRAGTTSDYYTGDSLPDGMLKNQKTERELVPVSLETIYGQPNQFGLYGMHGNVEEWCLDWYGRYSGKSQRNPGGPSKGIYRVTRGGSHNTPVEYLRSANRSASMPDDLHEQIGFRIVETGIRPRTSRPVKERTLLQSHVSQKKASWEKVPADKPYWETPVPFVVPPTDGTPFYNHNHQPAITWCSNGDLLAIWFSTIKENGREMVVLGSRMRKGSHSWDPASLFFKVPDRNMTGSSLLLLGDGTIMHVNGVCKSGDWKDLSMVTRFSSDNGRTWSDPIFSEAEHAVRHQVIAGPIICLDGTIIQCCDAGPGGEDGTSIHVSTDGGRTWNDTGATIPGIHAGLAQLKDGSLLAYGRGNSIDGMMPVSRSGDMGKTWKSSASEFLPISSGQRLVLKRLDEGPLMLATFSENGMTIHLSYDEGESWPVKKLLTDGSGLETEGGAWTGDFKMDAGHAEPKGYFACTQTPDGVIHLISSRLHYRFNLAWILD